LNNLLDHRQQKSHTQETAEKQSHKRPFWLG
jgi:hypothetical protein